MGLGWAIMITLVPLVHVAVWADPRQLPKALARAQPESLAMLGDQVLAMVTHGEA